MSNVYIEEEKDNEEENGKKNCGAVPNLNGLPQMFSNETEQFFFALT